MAVEILEDLSIAEKGSFYTILGVAGSLDEWETGITELFEELKIGKLAALYRTTGAAMNDYLKPETPAQFFPSDLTILMFPLDGLNKTLLSLFQLRTNDMWFDDIVKSVVRS